MLLLSEKNLNPIAGHLEKISWAVFGTLTWDNDSDTRYAIATERIHRKSFQWLVCKSAARLKLQTRNVAYYGKTEWGAAMHGHYNFLIARQGTENVSPEALAATMQDIWTAQRRRAEIEPFDPNRQRQGVRYQSKLEFENTGEPICPAEIISRALNVMLRKNAEAASVLILPPLPKPIPIHAISFTH
jgi:hypothetical protein